jgi:hypothetical protein
LKIAIAVAAGTSTIVAANRRSPRSPETSGESASETTMTTTAYVIHFNCCRSSPLERRKRTITDAADATSSPRRMTAVTSSAAPKNVFTPSMPIGLSGQSGWSSPFIGPGSTIARQVMNPITATSPPSTHRHPSPGTRPSGKSSGRNAIRPTAGNHVQT